MTSEKPNPSQELVQWFIKYRLRNGLEGCYSISTSEKDELWDSLPNICEGEGLNFFEFDSKAHRIIIQASQLIFFQFLFKPFYSKLPQDPDKDQDPDEDDTASYSVKVYFIDNPNPLIFQVDEDEPEDERNEGGINDFLYYASHVYKEEQVLHLRDEDGETAFFRATSIALIEVPLKLLQTEMS